MPRITGRYERTRLRRRGGRGLHSRAAAAARPSARDRRRDRRAARARRDGARPARPGGRHGALARVVPLLLRAQGGGHLLADRGHPGDPDGPARLRGGRQGRVERATADVQEVCNYLDAVAFARKQLRLSQGAAALDPAAQRDSPPAHEGRAGRREEPRARSAAARTGSAAPGPATPPTSRLRPTRWASCSASSRSSSTARATCRRSSGQGWPTSSSRRSTPTSTATAASAACSSRSCSSTGSCSNSRSST